MKTRYRMGAALGITAAATAALAMPQLASASVATPALRPAAAHTGTWNIDRTVDGGSTDTRSFVTTNDASTCVDAIGLTGSWHYQLIWYNDGRNTVLYTSRTFTAHGIHCSPTEVIKHGNAPKVYDKISVTGIASMGSGNYSITTN